ncbi:hypothetical protein [Serratia marcescens]|uniref:Rz1-like lysis system protein LysC n=1 Tax=Serratia marcescens TaxID=615 RepID=UPI003AB985F1
MSLYLLILSGCSATPLDVQVCPTELIPAHLLAHRPIPEFNVKTWGDYPDYLARLHLALEKCNSDKTTLAGFLHPVSQ